MKEGLSESLEDYLEAIYTISLKKGAARVKDVAVNLKVASASVNKALQGLAALGYLKHAPYDLITLTDKGREMAAGVVKKHDAIRHFLIHILDIAESEADEVACRLEHSFPNRALLELSKLHDFITGNESIMKSWRKYRK